MNNYKISDRYASKISITWPYKDSLLTQKRTQNFQKKISYIEVPSRHIDSFVAPKILTNYKEYPYTSRCLKRDSRSIVRENIIIKGDNLLVLHSLKEQFENRIKLIYIDPPYNTGHSNNNLLYSNNFHHSTWLSFMKSRLEVARELLTQDGLIWISIDHNELFYLGIVADEIFGRKNRLAIITVIYKPQGRNLGKGFSITNEYLLVYAKDNNYGHINNTVIDDSVANKFSLEDSEGNYKLITYIATGGGESKLRINKPKFWYPVYVSKDLKIVSLTKKTGLISIFPITSTGSERTWKTLKPVFLEKIRSKNIVAKSKNGIIGIYEKIREHQRIKTHWIDPKYNFAIHGTRLLQKTLGRKTISYSKSLYLIQDIIKLSTSKEDIILDFFSGSGTTGHATLNQNLQDGGNRNFILVEELKSNVEISIERLQKTIASAYLHSRTSNLATPTIVAMELKDYNTIVIDYLNSASNYVELNHRWNLIIAKIPFYEMPDVKDLWKIMRKDYLTQWGVILKNSKNRYKNWNSLDLDYQKRTLSQYLEQYYIYAPLSDINDSIFPASKEEKQLCKEFYQLN